MPAIARVSCWRSARSIACIPPAFFAADNTMAGVYGRGLAQALVGSETVYLVYEDGRVAASPLRSGRRIFGSAPPTEAVFGGLNREQTQFYTYAGSFVNDVRPAAFAAVNDSFYLLLENDNRLYRFFRLGFLSLLT